MDDAETLRHDRKRRAREPAYETSLAPAGGHVVDADALDALFRTRFDATDRSGGRPEFASGDWQVEVDAGAEVVRVYAADATATRNSNP